MELKGKNILVISPEGWHGLHMSKHHVSQGLIERGNNVWFWGTPKATTKKLEIADVDGLHIVYDKHWWKGLNRLPTAVNRLYYKAMIERIEARAGVRFDILWCFDTSRLQEFPRTHHYKLLHLVDFDILYHGHGLMRTADLIVTTADIISERVREIAPKATVHKVGHALDKRWLKGSEQLATKGHDRVRTVVYSGQFYNTYIDWEALLATALEHPTLAFKYIGNVDRDYPSDAFQQLLRLPNVEFTGLKNKDALIPLVREADILTFCFMTDKRMRERANPHKVLEYLSTGNLIVGTWTLEYEPYQDLLIMAPGQGDYVDKFRYAVEHFSGLNTPAQRAARIAFAQQRTVPALLDRVERLIASAE